MNDQFLWDLFEGWNLDQQDGWDDEDYYGPSYEPTERTCNQCGKTGLFWKKIDGSWRLASHSGKLHVCDFTNDFEVLPSTPIVVEPMITTHPLMKELLALPIYDQCLVHRFLYYVLSKPVMDDREYDMLERDATNALIAKMEEFPLGDFSSHALFSPGSDLEASYAPKITGLAYKIAFPELR